MTREDIKRAAEQNISSYSEIDFAELLANLGRECFCYGAEWRINSVWHKAEERPTYNRTFLYRAVYRQSDGEYTNIGTLVHGDCWDGVLEEEDIIAWAYLDDLMPDGKEE